MVEIMQKILLALSTVLLLSGCNTAPTSTGNTTTAVSTFDGAKTVAVNTHPVACNGITTCAAMGFAWSDKNPDQVSVLVKIDQMSNASGGDYHAISTVKLNVDGEIASLTPHLGGGNQFEQKSGLKVTSRLYNAPLSLLERIKLSTNTKIQIIAKGAIFEDDFKNSGDSTKAYNVMLKFLDEVEANK